MFPLSLNTLHATCGTNYSITSITNVDVWDKMPSHRVLITQPRDHTLESQGNLATGAPVLPHCCSYTYIPRSELVRIVPGFSLYLKGNVHLATTS